MHSTDSRLEIAVGISGVEQSVEALRLKEGKTEKQALKTKGYGGGSGLRAL